MFRSDDDWDTEEPYPQPLPDPRDLPPDEE